MIKKPYRNVNEVVSKFNSLYGEISDFQINRYNKLFDKFKNYFGESQAYFTSSSGRVEVCGNHTDHNGGQVIACTISLDSVAAFLPSKNGIIRIFSDGYGELIVDINKAPSEKLGTSQAIIRGVIEGIKKYNFKVGGFNAYVTSNVLGGAGISSSASFELLIVEIINFLYNDGIIDEEVKAKISQFAENEYFGKPCGLLDQTAISYGGLNVLDFFDNNRIIVKPIKNDLSDYTLILINTGGSHENLTDEYAFIPAEMYSVANEFGKKRLIEVSETDFYSKKELLKNKLTERAVLRAEHFFEENKRVALASKSLEDDNFITFLDVINKSGESSLNKLQNCYVAGSSEKPIVDALRLSKPFLNGGANRVHGGGFAGTILNVVKNEFVDEFISNMTNFYESKDIIKLKARTVGAITL